MLIALQAIEETIKYGNVWYSNPVFGVATATILLVVIILSNVAQLTYILNSQAKSNEKILDEINREQELVRNFGADLQEVRASIQLINNLNLRLIDNMQKIISQLSERQ